MTQTHIESGTYFKARKQTFSSEKKCEEKMKCSNRESFLCISPQEKLWEAVLAGDIDMIVSDHSPCTPDLKMPGEKDFMAAWGGISSLQFGEQTSHYDER